MSLGGSIHYFTQAVFNYPTLGEAYKYAAYDARGKMKRMGVAGAQAQIAVVPKTA
jgi:NAD(P) transhydrogenase